MASDRELYLGHLPQGLTADQLRPVFEAYGDLIDVRVIRDKNIGFVTYRSADSAAVALKDVTSSQILGVECDIKYAVPRTGGGGGGSGAPMQPMGHAMMQDNTPQRKIFVGNLCPGVSEMDINGAFAHFGRIVEVKCLNSNPMKPCGFVTFATLEEAEAAMQHMDGSVHPQLSADGKALSVKPSDPKGVKTLPSGTRLVTTPKPLGMGASSASAVGPQGAEAMMMEMLMTQCELAQQAGEEIPQSVLLMIQQISSGALSVPGGRSGGDRVMIANLPLDATDDYLRGMMAMVSTQITSVMVSEERGGMTGYVTFASASEAERLIGALDGIPNGAMMGKVLNVRWADRGQKRTGDFGLPEAMKMRTQQNAWPELTNGGNSNGIPEKVFIGGLPKTITETDVQALCGSFGSVQSVRIIRKESRPSTALVQYLTQGEAEAAIANLHDQQILDEKPLVCRFAEPLRNQALRGII